MASKNKILKILAIGDFHGEFPKKLFKKVKKIDPDLIVSPGDFCGSEEFSKLFFEHVYGTDKELEDEVGKEKVEKLEREIFESGIKILAKLKSLEKPIVAVTGNWDPSKWHDIGHEEEEDEYASKLEKEFRGGTKLIDFDNFQFGEYNFVGYPRSTYPGKETKHIKKKYEKEYGEERAKEIFDQIKKDNKEFFKRIRESFNGKNILLSHNCPYKVLDELKEGPQKGERYGSWLAKKVIREMGPFLVICGHIHENQGKKKTYNTLVVNPGAAKDGKAAVIEIEEGKKKIRKVEFLDVKAQ